MMAGWYRKHVAKEHPHPCEEEPNVSVVLHHVTDIVVAVPQENGFDNFKDYDNSEEDGNTPARYQFEMIYKLKFAKLVDL